MYQANELTQEDELVRASLSPEEDEVDEELDEDLDDEEDLTVYDDEEDPELTDDEAVIEEDFPDDSNIVIGDDEIDEIEQMDTRDQGVSKPHPSQEYYGDNTLTNTN
ncbi:hypothetical protein [Siphonobacter sp. SORGH_AS_0500]|uniref:hypothetical protein n=1 Tax=Siphonobacter sp. SORGH_AS_0500 TaxID=1864824 RepID=UPI00285B68E0|nr:hypothetical protein [Siphonobacter sp. SORGH_AS_0500]MDR6195690.1 hypothetical protein [Siphonobacter sp. SORGH_AS_0500]